jgi:hypothetical protein
MPFREPRGAMCFAATSTILVSNGVDRCRWFCRWMTGSFCAYPDPQHRLPAPRSMVPSAGTCSAPSCTSVWISHAILTEDTSSARAIEQTPRCRPASSLQLCRHVSSRHRTFDSACCPRLWHRQLLDPCTYPASIGTENARTMLHQPSTSHVSAV